MNRLRFLSFLGLITFYPGGLVSRENMSDDVQEAIAPFIDIKFVESRVVGEGVFSKKHKRFRELRKKEKTFQVEAFKRLFEEGETPETRFYGLLGLKELGAEGFEKIVDALDEEEVVKILMGSIVYRTKLKHAIREKGILVHVGTKN